MNKDVLTVLVFLLVVAIARHATASVELRETASRLRVGYYNSTCPKAEEIVREAVTARHAVDPTIAAGLIRLYFHDCFVRGCDASILLDETPSGDPVEKSSSANGFTLRGLDVIDAAKSALESACPATVSCADVLAFAARDAAALAGLRRYAVPAGRRDGVVSLASDVPSGLPSPAYSVDNMTALFARKGFSPAEMVVLAGAHSVGGAHCVAFSNRLYNFSATAEQDPAMDATYAAHLRTLCPLPATLADVAKQPKVDFDPRTATTLDTSYYVGLQTGRGLLASDQALMRDRRARAIVQRMAQDPRKWARKFAKAMVKLGEVEVLVGDKEGQIRTDCRFVNADTDIPFFGIIPGGIL
ncbi:peroxidase 5-like [Ananas comosus]|uniref:Peroxidase n=1 Tax=Ananas comosus TaxID=4615 RepID=A0A6P5EBU8_ANACO|nr:peroxidase 5-like [Ananas comosus]